MDSDDTDYTQILKLKRELIAENVHRVAFSSDHCPKVAALVLSNCDIVLWAAAQANRNSILKWIPWRVKNKSKVQAVAFQPESVRTVVEGKMDLIIITDDGNMFVLCVSKAMNDDPVQRCFTRFSLYPTCPVQNFVPTAAVWWSATHPRHKDIIIIGGNNGQLVFFSLTYSCYIYTLNTGSKSPIFSLSVCTDFLRDYSYLLITNDLRQQWKLLLEKEINGEFTVLLVFEESESLKATDKNYKVSSPHPAQKSRLQEFKQMSVETFAMLRQKINDSRRPNLDRPRSGSANMEPSEIQSCDCYGEAYLSVQRYKNRNVLTGLFIPESVLLLYLQNKETTTLIHHKFKISSLVTTLLLTNAFVYVADIMETQHRILVFSTRLSELKKNEPMEYNPISFVQSFLFPENEQIIGLFRTDKEILRNENFQTVSADSQSSTRSQMKQIRPEDEWNESCLVITNKGIYTIYLKKNPLDMAMDCAEFDVNMVKKICCYFNFSFVKIIEIIAGKLIESKNVDKALTLCTVSKCYSGKMTLKLASMGYIEELLTFTEYFLSISELDLPIVERIHLSNFVVTCYAEQYLRDSSNIVIRTKFLNFLKVNNNYDEEVNIHILGNYKLCSFVHFLTTWRGLCVDSAVALTNLIAQSHMDKFKNMYKFDGFWELFSENLLVDAFVLSPRTAHLHIQFIRENVNVIPESILEKLYRFYDPTQPALRPAMCRMLSTSKNEYLEAYDYESDKWGYDANMYDWITNFIFLHIKKFKNHNFDYTLNKYVSSVLNSAIPINSVEKKFEVNTFASSSILSAGFAHASVIRNGSVVTWGLSSSGCLGTGPTLSQNCAPTLNSWFDDHRIQVKQISCGRNHTLALTENGLYAWGSNKFGQLGVGRVGLSVYPRLVKSLFSRAIVFVDTGQYHSLAIDSEGILWTWGWGVYGQLGHGNIDDQYYPKIVERLKKKIIVSASGGQAHTVVLTNKGKIFTFGCNAYGQLGIGTTVKSTLPVKVFSIQERITLISTNYFHNLVLSESNRLYTWGCSPQILKLQSQTQKRARSMHNMAMERNQEYLDACNAGGGSDLGSGMPENTSYDPLPLLVDTEKHLSPTLVDTSLVEERITQVSCGLFHSALLTVNCQIYTWGRNLDGQLGNIKRHCEVSVPTPVNIYPLKLLPTNKQQLELLSKPLWRVSCGKDYTLAIEMGNRIFGWGNNCFGQLGTLPQEDFSIKRYLNGKFVVNKYTKRMIKVSHGGINIVEKPTEIQGLPKVQLMFNQNSNTCVRNLQIDCDLDLPGFTQTRFPIRETDTLFQELGTSGDQVLHYYLECFHRYYNAQFITYTCAKNKNYQAVSKICTLNFQFYKAFFYGLASLMAYVHSNYFFSVPKENYGQSKTRLLSKNVNLTKEEMSNEMTETTLKNNVVFDFVEDVIKEAILMLENYYKMVLKYTPEKVGSFLRKSLSAWIVWELPIQPLEWFFSKNWDHVAYPLAVFLFCEHYKSLIPVNDQEMKTSSQIGNSSSWEERKPSSFAHLKSKRNPLINKTVKYSFLNSTESKTYYRNLYPYEADDLLESNDPKYKLSSTEILKHLSIQFTLKLCTVIIDTMATKPNSEYEEFIRLLHEVIFAPSLLKSDNRSPDEVFNSVLSTLQKNQCSQKKFIHITYEELCEKPISDRFITFSCGHYFVSQSDFETEVSTVVRDLDNLHLVGTGELINRLFSNAYYTTCCPNCLFRYIECETH